MKQYIAHPNNRLATYIARQGKIIWVTEDGLFPTIIFLGLGIIGVTNAHGGAWIFWFIYLSLLSLLFISLWCPIDAIKLMLFKYYLKRNQIIDVPEELHTAIAKQLQTKMAHHYSDLRDHLPYHLHDIMCLRTVTRLLASPHITMKDQKAAMASIDDTAKIIVDRYVQMHTAKTAVVKELDTALLKNAIEVADGVRGQYKS